MTFLKISVPFLFPLDDGNVIIRCANLVFKFSYRGGYKNDNKVTTSVLDKQFMYIYIVYYEETK